MKKLLLLITGLLLLLSVEGQILRYSNYVAPIPEEPEEPSYPSLLDDEDTFIWYDFTQGVTKDNGTPDLVSQWNDLSGNARHMTQATAGNQPKYSATDGIILEDASDYMRSPAEATPYLEQPFFLYIVFQHNTGWVDEAYLFSLEDGGAYIKQDGTNPEIRVYAGATGLSRVSVSLNTWHIARVLLNGENSKLIIDNGTPVTGNSGTQNFIRAYLGDDDGLSAISKYKEIIGRSTDGSGGEEAAIYDYLVAKYSI